MWIYKESRPWVHLTKNFETEVIYYWFFTISLLITYLLFNSYFIHRVKGAIPFGPTRPSFQLRLLSRVVSFHPAPRWLSLGRVSSQPVPRLWSALNGVTWAHRWWLGFARTGCQIWNRAVRWVILTAWHERAKRVDGTLCFICQTLGLILVL